jgi:hypothetical protein
MPIPTGRPDAVLIALQKEYSGRTVWTRATTNPEAHYQQMAVMFGYIVEISAGFVLTDLGLREIQRPQPDPK